LGLAIGTAGSGYIEQPTVTFSGGGGSGAAAYATVGSGTTIKNLGNITTFATPNSNVLAIVDKNSSSGVPSNTTVAFSMLPNQSNFGANFLGSSAPLYFGTASSSTTDAFTFATSVGSPVSNGSGGSSQFRIVHTASAVNYVQVTGGATGVPPTISAQGSDATVAMLYRTKGNGVNHSFQNGSGNNGLVVTPVNSTANFLQITSSIATAAPSLASAGTDTNIDLALTPKGTGNVRFGTYTASMALTVQGYIEIKDSGGTIRKLAVIA